MNLTKSEIEILAHYSDTYIAYSSKMLNIIDSGSTMKELEKKLISKNITDAIITYIPPVEKAFSEFAHF